MRVRWLSQLVGGWLSDRIGRRRTMLIGFFGTAAALILLGSARSMVMIWVAAFLVGLLGDLFRPGGAGDRGRPAPTG